MLDLLFRGATVKYWLLLGFMAWLANLFQTNGSSLSFFQMGGSFRDLRSSGVIPPFPDPQELLRHEALQWVIGGAALIFLAFMLLQIIVLYLRSRGSFMFLENAVNGTDYVSHSWYATRQLGHSLFRWWLVYYLVMGAVAVLGVALFGLALWPILQGDSGPLSLLLVILIGLLLFLISMINAYINTFLIDFVVPLMYRFQISSSQAWSHLMQLVRLNWKLFIIYGIVRWLMDMAVATAASVIGVITCCIGMLPYIGTVLLLPLLVFIRFYSLEFLRQFSPEYSVFPQPPAVPSMPAEPDGTAS